MALAWGVTLAPAALAATAATLYYAMTPKKTRRKHSIAAEYLWARTKDAVTGGDDDEGVWRCANVCINGLMQGLGKDYFCVSGSQLVHPFEQLVEDAGGALVGMPIDEMLLALREQVPQLPEAGRMAFAEITVEYKYGQGLYQSTWVWDQCGGGIIHFPPYGPDFNSPPRTLGAPRVVSAFVLGTKRRNVTHFVLPWLGPRANFHVDVAPPEWRPSVAALTLVLRTNFIDARQLVLVDNLARVAYYDLCAAAATIEPPSAWQK